MNADKTEFICFNQDVAMPSLNVETQKLVDQSIHLGSNISSSESDVKIHT